MDLTQPDFEFRDTRSDWVRLRTLIMLRWTAVFGQLGAIVVATSYVGLRLPMGACLTAVGASVVLNLALTFIHPQAKRLSEGEALLTLLFDLLQLSFLLYLTGGLTNPFVLLVVAPVTISAAALELRTTLLLGAAAIALVSVIAVFKVPMRLADGTILTVPPLFEFGFWLSTVVGIAFMALYSRRIATEIHSMSDALFATQTALAREQKLTDLGGVVAAAAHELGTPLATITLVATEMIDELAAHPDLQADARLIREQADRCRDILRAMGRSGKDDLHMRQAPLSAVLHEAAAPHLDRGKVVSFALAPMGGAASREPVILRRPEIIHGLRNLVQNAVDFAVSRVWVDADWNAQRLRLRIVDDGAGYPPQMLGRLGDPFMRLRRSQAEQPPRPGYEGMGLGLFIAKTLLERTGAELTFANGADPFAQPDKRPERCGAVVEVIWPMSHVAAPEGLAHGPNPSFEDGSGPIKA